MKSKGGSSQPRKLDRKIHFKFQWSRSSSNNLKTNINPLVTAVNCLTQKHACNKWRVTSVRVPIRPLFQSVWRWFPWTPKTHGKKWRVFKASKYGCNPPVSCSKLGGGFKYFHVQPEKLGKMNPFWPLETTNRFRKKNSSELHKSTKTKEPQDLSPLRP